MLYIRCFVQWSNLEAFPDAYHTTLAKKNNCKKSQNIFFIDIQNYSLNYFHHNNVEYCIVLMLNLSVVVLLTSLAYKKRNKPNLKTENFFLGKSYGELFSGGLF